MALKPDRNEVYTDISFFMNETAERGGVVSFSSGGVGVAMDDANALVAKPTAVATDVPAGLLLNDVVNHDLTRVHMNWYKDEVQVGSKVTLLRRGFVVTNMLDPAAVPAAGAPAYFVAGGNLTHDAASGSAVVGVFLSSKDSDGYAKVDIHIA